MYRALIAELKQETATFNPALSRYEDFRVHFGDEILAAYEETQTELAGAIDVFRADGRIELIPTMAADAVSGGPVATTDLDRLLGEFADSIRKKHEVDGAYICFHGAMAGEEEGDPEGRVLSEIREILGERPIVVSLDLHAVVTDRLIKAADILVPYHSYPHTDHYQTGERAAHNLIRLLDKRVRPTSVRVRLPMLVRGDELITSTGRFGDAIRMCEEIEQSDGGLAAGVIIGNAFTDVPDLQSNVLVTTDNNLDRAQREADRISRFMWENRELFQAELTPLDEAIRLAEDTEGLTVFSDAADATASGAAGDSNAILKGLIESEFSGIALVPIVDANAVNAAGESGIGTNIQLALGGTRDPGRFKPITVNAYVKSLYDGRFQYENGTEARGGHTAVVVVSRIHVLVTEHPIYVVGRKVFQSHGLEPRDFDLVVVKSPNGFRTWYESIAAQIISVDVPGSTSANLKSLPYEHCVRPIFPLDDNVPSPFE